MSAQWLVVIVNGWWLFHCIPCFCLKLLMLSSFISKLRSSSCSAPMQINCFWAVYLYIFHYTLTFVLIKPVEIIVNLITLTGGTNWRVSTNLWSSKWQSNHRNNKSLQRESCSNSLHSWWHCKGENSQITLEKWACFILNYTWLMIHHYDCQVCSSSFLSGC